MTKADLIHAICQQTGIEREDVTRIVEAYLLLVKDQLAKGENIYVRGFGTFLLQKRARKTGRNITRNTAMVIEEHYVPRFKPGREFLELIKSKGGKTRD